MKSDAQLKKDVESELAWDPAIDAAHVGVSVRDGVVTLGGHIDNCAENSAIERATLRVAGVKAIAVELDVKLSPLHRRSDSEIAAAAEAVMQWNVLIPAERLRVQFEKGWLTLRGEVDWEYQRRSAKKAVCSLTGVVGAGRRRGDQRGAGGAVTPARMRGLGAWECAHPALPAHWPRSAVTSRPPCRANEDELMKNWLLIANAARARVLEETDRTGHYRHVADLVHPESRQKGIDLADDRPGHVVGGGQGGVGSSQYRPRTEPRERERDRFAMEVATTLNDAVAAGQCAGLTLVASDPFLGLVKGHLSEGARKAILRTVSSDYTQVPDAELPGRL